MLVGKLSIVTKNPYDGFPQYIQVNAMIMPQVRAQQFPFVFFLVYQTCLAFDAIYSMSSLKQNLPIESTNLFRKCTLIIIHGMSYCRNGHCSMGNIIVAW